MVERTLPKKKDPRGRPSHQPTADTRNLVALYLGTGCTINAVSHRLGISDDTLRKHYPDEVAMGKELNELFWVNSLAKAASKGNVQAITFALSRRFGWTEKSQISFPDDGEDGIIFETNREPVGDDNG